MKAKLIIPILILALCSFKADTFKNDQLRYSRVRNAYAEKEEGMLSLLSDKKINRADLNIYLRAFKTEEEIELWGKNKTDNEYQLINTYKVCALSGGLGPKRQQGDLQIPEGFYHINRFNPYSNFYLSLGINYPNTSDRILGVKGSLGGDIFIHGACVTIGCLPITDRHIKELYILCVEARNNGQIRIPVTIFPARLTDEKYIQLIEEYGTGNEGLWSDLKKGYDIFNEKKQLPEVRFLESGRHEVR